MATQLDFENKQFLIYDKVLDKYFYRNVSDDTWVEVPLTPPPPPPVSGGETITKSFTAGQIINGGKAVRVDTDGKLYLFDINNPSHYGKYVGIAQQSSIVDDPCEVVLRGKAAFGGSGWVAGQDYYIDSTGLLTATPPSTGLVKRVAVGITTDEIVVIEGEEFEAI